MTRPTRERIEEIRRADQAKCNCDSLYMCSPCSLIAHEGGATDLLAEIDALEKDFYYHREQEEVQRKQTNLFQRKVKDLQDVNAANLKLIADLENRLWLAAEKTNRYKNALIKIEDITSALFLPGRPSSYADFELRAIAREALKNE